MQDLLYIALSILPFLAGLLITRFTRLHIKPFQGIFLFLAAAHIFIVWSFLSQAFAIQAIVAIGIGLVMQFVAMAIAGNKLPHELYKTFLMGIGLFPWFWASEVRIFFLLLIIIVVPLIAYIKVSVVLRKMGLKRIKKAGIKKQFEKVGAEELYEDFVKKADIRISLYFAVCGVLALGGYYLMWINGIL